MNWQVTEQERGTKLLDFLRKKCIWGSGKCLKRAIDERSCFVNGKLELFATTRLRQGDMVELNIRDPSSRGSIETLWEDDHILIVNKPSGICCEPRVFTPYRLVHRLDKETTGVFLLARHAKAAEALHAQFRKRFVDKYYLAVVAGQMREKQGVVNLSLGKTRRTVPGQTVYGPCQKGLPAMTRWKCIDQKEGVSLCLCQPVTGRTHQLRVHLRAIHHPIVGDVLYGRFTYAEYAPPRLLLHAYRLCFHHPITNQKIQVEAPLPVDLTLFLAQKGLHFGQGKGIQDVAFF